MFPELKQASLLVHITFHFVEDRIQYLEQVTQTIAHYPFKRINLVIDTNSPQLSLNQLPHLANCPHLEASISVHTQMDHPFLLTWQHRPIMEQQIGHYDYYMYVEDDIAVPAKVIERWHRGSQKLYPLGYLQGFLRTEVTPENILVSTDQFEPTQIQHFLTINGDLYYSPPNPYHGFWIYSNGQMLDFKASSCWKDGNNDNWGVREQAAAGMIWRDPKQHKTVIPVAGYNRVPDDVLVQHIPNNYASNPADQYGNMPISSLFSVPLKEKLKFLVLRLLG